MSSSSDGEADREYDLWDAAGKSRADLKLSCSELYGDSFSYGATGMQLRSCRDSDGELNMDAVTKVSSLSESIRR